MVSRGFKPLMGFKILKPEVSKVKKEHSARLGNFKEYLGHSESIFDFLALIFLLSST
jgi:hypothetical protein